MGLPGVEFIMAVEEAFGVAIPDADAQQLFTPAHVVRYLESERTVKRLLFEQLGINEFKWDQRFVGDLRVH